MKKDFKDFEVPKKSSKKGCFPQDWLIYYTSSFQTSSKIVLQNVILEVCIILGQGRMD